MANHNEIIKIDIDDCVEISTPHQVKEDKKIYPMNLVPSKLFHCNFCTFKVSNETGFISHMISVHFGKRYSCPECEYNTKNKQSFRRHVKSIHEGEVFPCQLCEYKGKDKSYLTRHMQHVHDEKIQKCPKCDLVTNKINMSRHIKLYYYYYYGF